MNRLRFLLGTLAAVFALVASTANAQPTLQASSQDDPVRISAELTMHDATSGVLTVRAEIADGFHGNRMEQCTDQETVSHRRFAWRRPGW